MVNDKTDEMQGGNLERNEGRHVMAVTRNAFIAD
jgi:hypothetical protein